MWLGISADEQIRMRTSPDRWIMNRYPLVDSAMSRSDCIAWFAERWPDRRLPRSACAGCPYRSAESWAELRETEPHTFAEAVRIDALLRYPDHHAFRMFRKRVFCTPAGSHLLKPSTLTPLTPTLPKGHGATTALACAESDPTPGRGRHRLT